MRLSQYELDDLERLNPPDDPRMFRRFLDTIREERDTASLELDVAMEALYAASHALRSYQYGNSATYLAKEIADKIDAISLAYAERKAAL